MNTYTTTTALEFRPLTIEAVDSIRPILENSRSRTCDYTVAGLLMWARYFHYEYAIVDDTLFIKGVCEDDVTRPAFSMPVGAMSPADALQMVVDYCREHDMPVNFSAVPEDRIADFHTLGPCRIDELTDWADYLYNADDLANLTGKKYSKKRNHVNAFASEHPGYTFQPLTPELIPAVKEFFSATHLTHDDHDLTAEVERMETFRILDNYTRLPFEGAVLSVPGEGIVAFAIGEIIGDTLYVHIEKMRHDINGAGETINKLFAAAMRDRYGVSYVNREEDVGDEGLRHAKQSYHPVALLKKYNITL